MLYPCSGMGMEDGVTTHVAQSKYMERGMDEQSQLYKNTLI